VTESPNTLLDTIRKIVREELRQAQGATLAIVQEQHLGGGEYACTVKLRDSELVLSRVPVATARMGLASLPAVNDLVLLQFIHGDINRPVIIGSLYNDEDSPPESADGEWICRLPLGAGDSDGIELHAKSAEPSLSVRIGGGLVLELKDDDPVISIDIGSGSAELTVASDGAVSIGAGTSVSIEAGADLELKGANVKIEGSGEVAISGAVINLN
jgi:hypothetical protein